jgi:predicted GNAT superfamily acetyltransferase
MGEEVQVRPLASVGDMEAASALIDRIWGEERIVVPALLRALSAHGNPVYGAWLGEQMVGAQVGFVGITEEGPVLHSHITGVAPGLEHRGIGRALKLAQREWCLEHEVDVVTWTFDPMIARNAYFNLMKLGAIGVAFHRNYYGDMADVFNVGERSDRLEVRWEVRSDRVVRALEGRPEVGLGPAQVILQEADGRPQWTEPQWRRDRRVLITVPSDYLELKQRDADLARLWRDATADGMEAAFSRSYHAVAVLDLGNLRGYLLERTIDPLVA